MRVSLKPGEVSRNIQLYGVNGWRQRMAARLRERRFVSRQLDAGKTLGQIIGERVNTEMKPVWKDFYKRLRKKKKSKP